MRERGKAKRQKSAVKLEAANAIFAPRGKIRKGFNFLLCHIRKEMGGGKFGGAVDTDFAGSRKDFFFTWVEIFCKIL